MPSTTPHRRLVGAALTTALLFVPTLARASAPVAPPVEPLELREASAPGPAPAPAPIAEPQPRGFVMSATLGVNFLPVYPVPSGEFSLFLGGTLPIKTFRPSHWLALGYRGALAGGFADLLNGDLIALRHHLALQGAAGKRTRLFYGVSVGVAHFPALAHDRHPVFALEGEGRLGGLFGAGDLKFLFGAQLRLTGPVGQFQEGILLPTIGLFFGVNFGPRMRMR